MHERLDIRFLPPRLTNFHNKPSHMKILINSLLTFLLVSCNSVKEKALELTTINCHMQSPVNIIPSQGVGSAHQVMVHYDKSNERVANLGHTVEVEYDSGSYVSYDGMDYQFKQFHFHTPSEHMVQGDDFDMEMHIVHTYEGENEESPQYLVIGVFFKEGEANGFLSSFLDAIPKTEGEVFETDEKSVNAAEMIPETLADFYNYRGSLTTPPYTESVNWIVLKNVNTASAKQIETIRAIEGENARRVQFLYSRVVETVN